VCSHTVSLNLLQVSQFLVQPIREDGLVVGAPQSFTLETAVAKSAADLQVAYDWSSGTPQRLKFKVAATDGTFTGTWSAEAGVVTVGEWQVLSIEASGFPYVLVSFPAAPCTFPD